MTIDHYVSIESTNDKHRSLFLMMKRSDRRDRVANADLNEITQQYAGYHAALEAGNSYFTIYDALSEYLDVTLANPAKADWLAAQQQKDDRKVAKNLAQYLRMGEISKNYVPPEE